MKRLLSNLLAAALTFWMAGCQGRPSAEPPIHVNPNMDIQPKYKAQSWSEFFVNSSTMRVPPAGTVAMGELREGAYYTGRDDKGALVRTSPVPLTARLMARGQERFNIYCLPCHGGTGIGNGIVIKRGYLPPPSFHTDLMRGQPDGHFYDVITNGIRNMPSYKSQVSVADRWAIVAYIRALQRSQYATLEDVPLEIRKELK